MSIFDWGKEGTWWGSRAIGRTVNALAGGGKAMIDAGIDPLAHPIDSIVNAKKATGKGYDAALDFGVVIYEWEKKAWDNRGEVGKFAVYAWDNPERAAVSFGAGCLKGGVGFGGMVMDAGRGIARHTNNLGAAEGDMWTNKGKDLDGDGEEDMPYKGYSDRWREGTGNWADEKFVNPVLLINQPYMRFEEDKYPKLDWGEKTKYDKAWGWTGEAGFEVLAFVAAAAATGGVGGFALGALRGGALSARGLTTGIRTFKAGESLMKPFRTAVTAAKGSGPLSTMGRGALKFGEAISPLKSSTKHAKHLTEAAEKLRKTGGIIKNGRTLQAGQPLRNTVRHASNKLNSASRNVQVKIGNTVEHIPGIGTPLRQGGNFLREGRFGWHATRYKATAQKLGQARSWYNPAKYTTLPPGEALIEGAGAGAYIYLTRISDNAKQERTDVLNESTESIDAETEGVEEENKKFQDADLDDFINGTALSSPSKTAPISFNLSGTFTALSSHDKCLSGSYTPLLMSTYTATPLPSPLGKAFLTTANAVDSDASPQNNSIKFETSITPQWSWHTPAA